MPVAGQHQTAFNEWIKEGNEAKRVVENAKVWSGVSHEQKMRIYDKLKQLHDDCHFDDESSMADHYKEHLGWNNFDSVWEKVLAEEDKKQFLAQFNDINSIWSLFS